MSSIRWDHQTLPDANGEIRTWKNDQHYLLHYRKRDSAWSLNLIHHLPDVIVLFRRNVEDHCGKATTSWTKDGADKTVKLTGCVRCLCHWPITDMACKHQVLFSYRELWAKTTVLIYIWESIKCLRCCFKMFIKKSVFNLNCTATATN